MTKKILLVIDMQNDFITGALGTEAAQAIVDPVTQFINSWDSQIWVTQDTHFDDYLTTPEGIKLPIEHCIYNTEGWKVQKDIYSALCEKGERVNFWRKQEFADIQLMKQLCKDHSTELHIIGLDTDICVISNAIIGRTLAPAMPIYVHASCCAGSTPENHMSALAVMRSCQIDII